MDIVELISSAFTNPLLASFAGVAGLLILADAFFGALGAVRDGSFKLEWLYAFAKEKGTLFIRILATFVFGAAIPNIQLGDASIPNPLLGYAGIEGAAFILSLYASVRDNLKGEGRGYPPEGITPPAPPVIEPVVGPIVPDEEEEGVSH